MEKQKRKHSEKKQGSFYRRYLYGLLKVEILLCTIVISHCILNLSFRSARKLSKLSFLSRRQLLYMENLVITSV